ncbi:hypothetical protein [Pseudoalteromonas xiamenensis]
MMSTSLQAALQPWFDSFPQGELISALISNGVGVVLLMVLYGFTRRLMLPSIQSLMTRLSPSRIGHLSGQLNKANRRLAMLITIVAFLASFEQILVLPDWGMELCRTGGQVFWSSCLVF